MSYTYGGLTLPNVGDIVTQTSVSTNFQTLVQNSAGATAPTANATTGPRTGQLWYDTTALVLKINAGTPGTPEWVVVSNDLRYQVAATAPTARANSTTLVEGDKYYNTANDTTFTWSGTAWVGSAGQFDWQTNTTSTPPTTRSDGSSALVVGDMYFDSTGITLYSWDGTTWTSEVSRKKSYFFASFF